MFEWTDVRTVFLDMDGTLLDLHFDNYFWLEHVPRRYAEKTGLDFAKARRRLLERYREVEGTIQWYCLDYWSRELGMDIPVLKEEVDHLINVHPHVPEFLDRVRKLGKRVVLVTNAHGKSLELKMSRTRLGGCLDRMISAHDLGVAKEQPQFWKQLQSVEEFDPRSTMLVDDSIPVLRSAQRYGIRHLLGVKRPDSQRPAKEITGFPSITSFKEILP